MIRYIPLIAVLAVTACGTTPTEQASLTNGAITLASVAAANNTTVASLVTKGALFCQQQTITGTLVVAAANAAGAPVSVTGQLANDVAQACAALGAVPVPPPADPASAPVKTVPAGLPAAV